MGLERIPEAGPHTATNLHRVRQAVDTRIQRMPRLPRRVEEDLLPDHATENDYPGAQPYETNKR